MSFPFHRWVSRGTEEESLPAARVEVQVVWLSDLEERKMKLRKKIKSRNVEDRYSSKCPLPATQKDAGALRPLGQGHVKVKVGGVGGLV